jgi:hypothetical protein
VVALKIVLGALVGAGVGFGLSQLSKGSGG